MTTRVCQQTKNRSRLTKEEWREYTKTVWAIANKSREDHPAVFPEEIPLRLAKMFSFHGETVLDPFAGTGTTARAAIPIGRRVICVDQNPAYVETIRKECGGLLNGHDPGCEALEAVHGDSRDLGFIETDTVALIVTSPPTGTRRIMVGRTTISGESKPTRISSRVSAPSSRSVSGCWLRAGKSAWSPRTSTSKRIMAC